MMMILMIETMMMILMIETIMKIMNSKLAFPSYVSLFITNENDDDDDDDDVDDDDQYIADTYIQ